MALAIKKYDYREKSPRDLRKNVEASKNNIEKTKGTA